MTLRLVLLLALGLAGLGWLVVEERRAVRTLTELADLESWWTSRRSRE